MPSLLMLQPPPAHILERVCSDATFWLTSSESPYLCGGIKQGEAGLQLQEAKGEGLQRPHRVVVIHCKAGKGRTGAVVCALLLHLVRGEASPYLTQMVQTRVILCQPIPLGSHISPKPCSH